MIDQYLPCCRVACVECGKGAVELSSFPCLASNSIFLCVPPRSGQTPIRERLQERTNCTNVAMVAKAEVDMAGSASVDVDTTPALNTGLNNSHDATNANPLMWPLFFWLAKKN